MIQKKLLGKKLRREIKSTEIKTSNARMFDKSHKIIVVIRFIPINDHFQALSLMSHNKFGILKKTPLKRVVFLTFQIFHNTLVQTILELPFFNPLNQSAHDQLNFFPDKTSLWTHSKLIHWTTLSQISLETLHSKKRWLKSSCTWK